MPILSTSHIPLSKIKTDSSRSSYNQSLIDEIANLILQGDGLISPLVVMQEPTLIHYKLISGFLEYHASMRARELNLEKAESVQAYIIGIDFEEERKKALEAQVTKFKETKASAAPAKLPEVVGEALKNLESRFDGFQYDVTARLESFNINLKNLSHVLNEVIKTVSNSEKMDKKSPGKVPKPKIKININDPSLTVMNLRKVGGIGDSNAQQILDLRNRKGGKFDSLNDLLEMNGVGMKTFTKWTEGEVALVCE